ncbi:lipase 3-like [Macrosteles quadrilineatus]|uniref:lipase 3-like n=1 Tax=Macrosteles quadrilineatus TaxID=74068 RepID=UPI0023E17DCB|nr:lipase 3-like [Macrosteles quadrilineatus]
MIQSERFQAEEHRIVTEDGYLLVIHRIPPSTRLANGRVVIYFHGLFGSSTDIVIRGRDKGLGFLMSLAGFDVWLPNLRGSADSQLTVNVTKDNPWDFSWDENALYDFPAIIDYVLAVSGSSKVSIVGLSMAGNVVLGGLSLRPEYNQKLSGAVFLAPTSRLKYTRSIVKRAAPHWRWVYRLIKDSGVSWIPFMRVDVFHRFMAWMCSLPHVGPFLCASLMFSTESIVFTIEKDLLQKVFAHYPHPGSTKSVVHFLQIMNSGRFCMFDYGPEDNMLRYNRSTPPEYDLSSVDIPVAIFYSHWDTMVSYQDVEWLASQLKNTILAYSVPKYKFAHLSFMWDPNIDSLVYNRVINVLQSL